MGYPIVETDMVGMLMVGALRMVLVAATDTAMVTGNIFLK